MSDIKKAASSDSLPTIAKAGGTDWVMWAFFALLAVGGAFLVSALTASQEAADAPAIAAAAPTGERTISSPPPLQVPERFSEKETAPQEEETRLVERPLPPVLPRVEPPLPPAPRPQFQPLPPLPVATPAPAEPRVVFDSQSRPAPLPANSAGGDAKSARVTAERFVNPSLTIPQGTVIPAVLETALDSTRPGGVRALVQRDVLGFDGSRVLVPRGSRLYGEYQANLQPGQNRALVQWTRLIRPDGVTIALDSPSSDPLGRAGVRGKVDSKFLQRFGSALLQSIVDVGVNVAVSEATDGVIVALPGSTQNVQVADPQRFQPTLKVKHGTSVSVFVARDLDFSTVDS